MEFTPEQYALAIKLASYTSYDSDFRQDCAILAWEKIARFEPDRGSYKTWLVHHIIPTVKLRWIRQGRKMQKVTLSAAEQASLLGSPKDALAVLQTAENFKQLEKAWLCLSDQQKWIVALNASGYTGVQIAEIIARAFGAVNSRANVNSQLYLARKKLAKVMQS